MKLIGFLFCLIVFSSAAYSQQFLWSTSDSTSPKYVPIKDVTVKVLEFFDFYKCYYDGAGYSKNSFVEAIDKYGDKSQSWKDFKQKIVKIENLTVFAARANLGKGSVVLVICVTKENVNFISFSNNYESGCQVIIPTRSEKDKFSKWFKTLLE